MDSGPAPPNLFDWQQQQICVILDERATSVALVSASLHSTGHQQHHAKLNLTKLNQAACQKIFDIEIAFSSFKRH